jgi:hypothetical protein
MVRIDENTYRTVANELQWRDEPKGMALRLLAIHQSSVSTENVEGPSGHSTGFGIALDAPRILRSVARNGVHLALHGHKHKERSFDLGSLSVVRTSAKHKDQSTKEYA